MHDNRPIGLFDSGLGGLTVFREVNRILPSESVIYFGDTAHVPYGSRPTGELIELADRIVAYLIGQGVKYIIFACNTSSALSLAVLQQKYQLPMLGIIEPGAAEAMRLTRNKRVGVIATVATTKSEAYNKALGRMDREIQVFSHAAPLLVPLVEAVEPPPDKGLAIVKESLIPWQDTGIDTLLLGCTHYPFLAEMIAGQLASGVTLVDPAEATVRLAAKEMAAGRLLAEAGNRPSYRFVVSGQPEDFRYKAELLTGGLPGEVERVAIDN